MRNEIDPINSEALVERIDQANEMGKDIFVPLEVPKNLTRFIKGISIANCTEPVNFTTPIPPNGCTYLDLPFRGEMVCTVDSVTEHHPVGELRINGQVRDEVVQMNFCGRVGRLIIHFAPLGAYELLGVTGQLAAGRSSRAIELSDRTKPLALELSEVIAQSTATENANATDTELADLLLETMTQHLSHYACEPLSAPDYLHQAVAIADDHHGAVRVSDIATKVGVSERQLSREFSRLVGIPPKFYCRVLQINTALENMLRNEEQQMVDVALQGDFTDQSHFNRVFRQFLDMNPREYLNSDELMLSHFLANWQGPHRA